jgi:predicted type IV restriction endonuclease
MRSHVAEYYPTLQGRPQRRVQIDMNSGRTIEVDRYLILKEEYDKVEALLDKLLNEEISRMTEILIELKQMKLQLASISDEAISEEDVDVE